MTLAFQNPISYGPNYSATIKHASTNLILCSLYPRNWIVELARPWRAAYRRSSTDRSIRLAHYPRYWVRRLSIQRTQWPHNVMYFMRNRHIFDARLPGWHEGQGPFISRHPTFPWRPITTSTIYSPRQRRTSIPLRHKTQYIYHVKRC